MKKINGIYSASATDTNRAAAHCRNLARKAAYDGSIEAWLNQESGEISYIEHIGNGYCEANSNMILIAYAYTPARR